MEYKNYEDKEQVNEKVSLINRNWIWKYTYYVR
jgi:hypothetical protein